MRNIDITFKGAQDMFFEELNSNNKTFFEFTLDDKKEVISILKINKE
jgi:hypothetical protein